MSLDVHVSRLGNMKIYCKNRVRPLQGHPHIKFDGTYLCTRVEIDIKGLKKALPGRGDSYNIL